MHVPLQTAYHFYMKVWADRLLGRNPVLFLFTDFENARMWVILSFKSYELFANLNLESPARKKAE